MTKTKTKTELINLSVSFMFLFCCLNAINKESPICSLLLLKSRVAAYIDTGLHCFITLVMLLSVFRQNWLNNLTAKCSVHSFNKIPLGKKKTKQIKQTKKHCVPL